MNQVSITDEFRRGGNDCKNGVPHKPGQPEDYDRGYNAEYHTQAMSDHKTRHKGHRHGQNR